MYKQSKTDLLKHLREQIQFLARSAASFDDGYDAEGKRIAAVLRVLCHDTKSSKSLLGQLDLKGILFYDTAPDFDPRNLIPHHGLVGLEFGGSEGKYKAHLDNRPPQFLSWCKFDEWWNKLVIVVRGELEYSRRQLVLAVANKDGGAHIDPSLSDSYAALTRNNAMGWIQVKDGRDTPLASSVELASVRQIAFELVSSLEKHSARFETQ